MSETFNVPEEKTQEDEVSTVEEVEVNKPEVESKETVENEPSGVENESASVNSELEVHQAEDQRNSAEKVEEVREKIRNIPVDKEEDKNASLEISDEKDIEGTEVKRAEKEANEDEASIDDRLTQEGVVPEEKQEPEMSRRDVLGLDKIKKMTEDAKAEAQKVEAETEIDPEKTGVPTEDEEGDISRRDFIKQTGAAAVGAMAGGAMSGFVKPPEAKAGLKETLEFDDVKEGSHDEMVKELYDVVFENNKEIARFHFKSTEEFKTKQFFKGKTDEGWFDGKGIEYAESSVIIPPDNFEVLMEDPSKLERISFFHTHPAAAIENINEQLEKGISVKELVFEEHAKKHEERDRMALAISEPDLNVFMNVCMEYPQAADKFSMELLEPTGHWKIERDSEDEAVENFERMQKEYQQEVDKFNKLKEDEKNEYRKKATLVFMEENRENGLSELRGILSDKNAIFTTFKKNEEYFSQLKMLAEIGRKMILCKSDEKREEVAEKFIEAAKIMGLSAEYNQMRPKEKKVQRGTEGGDR